MPKYKQSVEVPIHVLKQDTGFYLCYKYDGKSHGLLRCWYGKGSDFFFYPLVNSYKCFLKKGNELQEVQSDVEEKHQRITIHQSGVIVGPDKHSRRQGHKYERLKKPIKECRDGVRLAIHKLAGPAVYEVLNEKTKKKGNWAEFAVTGTEVQPVISIDAYPIFSQEDLNRIKAQRNYIVGFFTKNFSENYRMLIMFELKEEELVSNPHIHEVYVPLET